MLFEFFEVLFWFGLPLIAMVMSNLASKDPDLLELPQVPRIFFNRKCIESLNYFKTKCWDSEPQPTTSWWLNQPIWKIWSSDWIISPKIGVKIRNIWVATTNQQKTCWKGYFNPSIGFKWQPANSLFPWFFHSSSPIRIHTISRLSRNPRFHP